MEEQHQVDFAGLETEAIRVDARALELWHARYNKAKARSMEQGISSALLRLGGAHDVDEDNLHQILRRIHDALLIVIQVRSLRQEQPTSHVCRG